MVLLASGCSSLAARLKIKSADRKATRLLVRVVGCDHTDPRSVLGSDRYVHITTDESKRCLTRVRVERPYHLYAGPVRNSDSILINAMMSRRWIPHDVQHNAVTVNGIEGASAGGIILPDRGVDRRSNHRFRKQVARRRGNYSPGRSANVFDQRGDRLNCLSNWQ